MGAASSSPAVPPGYVCEDRLETLRRQATAALHHKDKLLEEQKTFSRNVMFGSSLAVAVSCGMLVTMWRRNSMTVKTLKNSIEVLKQDAADEILRVENRAMKDVQGAKLYSIEKVCHLDLGFVLCVCL